MERVRKKYDNSLVIEISGCSACYEEFPLTKQELTDKIEETKEYLKMLESLQREDLSPSAVQACLTEGKEV